MTPNPDLAFAALAIEMGEIDPDVLNAELRDWLGTARSSLADRLVERGCLAADARQRIATALQVLLAQPEPSMHLALAISPKPAPAAAVDKTVDLMGNTLAIEATPSTGGSTEPSTGFSLVSRHAEGGLGTVWLAKDESLARTVAIKELRPALANNAEACQRFLSEAKITGQLEHPNIVPVYHLGSWSETHRPFYAMKFVRGPTFEHAIREFHQQTLPSGEKRLMGERLLRAFVSVCQAVAYAHSRGVIHRDLKPENVVLGDFGEVLVLDWGLAKVIGEDEQPASSEPSDEPTVTGDRAGQQVFSPTGDHPSLRRAVQRTVRGRVLGTPAYMAPEQAAGLPDLIGRQTDIYGLGAILFEIVTGDAPHQPKEGEDTIQMFRRLATEDSPRTRQRDPSASPVLDAVCAKAMAPDAEDRYATPLELAEEIERFLSGQPVRAYREPFAQAIVRWSLRHRGWTQTLCATAIATFLAVALSAANAWRDASVARSLVLDALGDDALILATEFSKDLDRLRRQAVVLSRFAAARQQIQPPPLPAGEPGEPLANALDKVFKSIFDIEPSLLAIEWKPENEAGGVGSRFQRSNIPEGTIPNALAFPRSEPSAQASTAVKGVDLSEIHLSGQDVQADGRGDLLVTARVHVESEGKRQGDLLLTIDVAERFVHWQPRLSEGRLTWLADEEGRLLSAPSERDLESRPRVQDWFPETEGSWGARVPMTFEEAGEGHESLAIHQVFLDEPPGERFVSVVVSQAPSSPLTNRIAFRNGMFAVAALVALAALAFAWLVPRLLDRAWSGTRIRG